jgi:HKD family nuclease
MKIEVIPNRGPASMGAEIDRSLLWAGQVDIASAFVTAAALKRLRAALAYAETKKRPLKVRLLFGLYQRFTSPQAMSEMLSLRKQYPSKFSARVARNNRFHWKLYSFSKGNQRRLYVGSANFTSDGLGADGELSLKVTAKSSDAVVKSVANEFETMWQEDSFLLDKPVLNKYEKLARPKEIFTAPQKDTAISALLRPPAKPTSQQKLSNPKPRLVYMNENISDETAEMLGAETDWYRNGWDSSSLFYKGQSEAIKQAKIILLVEQLIGGKLLISFRRIEGFVSLDTPDGKYHFAHSHVPYGWSRVYSEIKKDLAEVGLTQKKMRADRYLNSFQLERLCRLLHVKPERLGLSKSAG